MSLSSSGRRLLTPIVVPFLMLSIVSSARADAYDGFDYPPGNAGPQNGGTGFVAGSRWQFATVAAGSLSDPSGTLATTGNHAQAGQSFVERRLEQVMGTPGTDVWVSWLQRRDRNLPGFQGLLLARPTGTGWSGTYFVGEPGAGPGDNTYVIGAGGDDFNVVSSGVPVVPNETAFLVAPLQFREGNDLATLYVNPTPGAAAPAGGVTYSGLDMPLVNPILSFQGTGPAGGPAVVHAFDELRVGDSYADVAPAVPEPACAAFAAVVACAGLVRRARRG